MLTVPVILKKSSIKGRGIFAKNNIKKGTIIVRIGEKERYYTKEQYKKFSPRFKKNIGKFVYWDKIKQLWVYPLDYTKYLNHSCEANVLNKGNIDVAVRDIKKGEELTYNYSPILAKGEKFKCYCGSRYCKGIIKPS